MLMVELEREIAVLLERTNALEAASAKVTERNVALERENKILRDELAILKQGLFGRRTERLEPGQLDLYLKGAEPKLLAALEAAQASDLAREQRTSAAGGHGRARFAEHFRAR